jgi:ankyrin repeat protein
MGNTFTFGSSTKRKAVLLQPAIAGDLDKVKELVGTFLATYCSTSNEGYVNPASDPKLHDFVNKLDPQGNNAMHGAVFAGHLEIVKYLVECCGASLTLPNNLGCFPLWLAAGYNRTQVLEYLLIKLDDQALLQTNSSGDTPLVAAASRGNLDACKILLDQAKKTKMVEKLMALNNQNGDTPLKVAIANSEGGTSAEELVDLLLTHTSDILLNTPNKIGLTPLLVACERDDDKLLAKLLDHNADITICDATGASPLAVAAFCGSKDVLAVLLLEKDFAQLLLEQPNQNGCTPLWLAARSGRPQVVDMFLKAGADPTIKNKDGLSPIDAAIKYKRVEVSALFNASSNEQQQQS